MSNSLPAGSLENEIANALFATNGVVAESRIEAASRRVSHYEAAGKEDAVVILRVSGMPITMVSSVHLSLIAQTFFERAPLHAIKFLHFSPEGHAKRDEIFLESVYRLPCRGAKRFKGKAKAAFLCAHAMNNLATLVASSLPFNDPRRGEILSRYPDPRHPTDIKHQEVIDWIKLQISKLRDSLPKLRRRNNSDYES
jgi:hypothetical protein